jgi:hypothetical protein
MTAKSQSDISVQFKRCPMCGATWVSRHDFLADPDVGLVGYQVNFADLVAGIFLFNHNCGDTLSIPVGAFRDLHNGPVFSARATGTSDCPGHCLREDDLDPCPTHCECNFVREIIQVIKSWPKAR